MFCVLCAGKMTENVVFLCFCDVDLFAVSSLCVLVELYETKLS